MSLQTYIVPSLPNISYYNPNRYYKDLYRVEVKLDELPNESLVQHQKIGEKTILQHILGASLLASYISLSFVAGYHENEIVQFLKQFIPLREGAYDGDYQRLLYTTLSVSSYFLNKLVKAKNIIYDSIATTLFALLSFDFGSSMRGGDPYWGVGDKNVPKNSIGKAFFDQVDIFSRKLPIAYGQALALTVAASNPTSKIIKYLTRKFNSRPIETLEKLKKYHEKILKHFAESRVKRYGSELAIGGATSAMSGMEQFLFVPVLIDVITELGNKIGKVLTDSEVSRTLSQKIRDGVLGKTLVVYLPRDAAMIR